MADTFKNSGLDVTTAYQSLYTAPSATQSVVHTLNLSNTSTNIVNVGARVFDASVATERVLFEDLPIAPGGSFVYPKSINLEPTDRIEIISDTTGVVEAFASIIERT